MHASQSPSDRGGPAANVEPVLIGGRWRPSVLSGTFHAVDPTTGRDCDRVWPVSTWTDLEAALTAATAAAVELSRLPGGRIAAFLERYAERLGDRGTELVATAHTETALPVKPRLAEVELPRTLDQLRQAAAAAREGTWRMAMIDSARNIRSAAFGLGPVVVLPPGNFPLAYGAVTGGDFAAAIAAGNPVIAKAHPGHPGVSRIAAEEALAALGETGLPPATVQLVHGLSNADGERLVAEPRVGATGFTGGQEAGKRLFTAAAAAGRVAWVEMGSLNPVVLLPGALAERSDEISGELTTSVTGSAGQFCTKPGLVFFLDDASGRAFVAATVARFQSLGAQVMLGPLGRERLVAAIGRLRKAGARLLAGTEEGEGPCGHAPTLLEVTATELGAHPESLLVEAFGNATLLVHCRSIEELERAVCHVGGSLGASIYVARSGADDALFGRVAGLLEQRSGRIIENRMPTGLAVTPPMQHGGPWPSAGPPFFSAVGLPWSILRFARRICFDGWAPARLPECVRDAPPTGLPWRYVDQAWTRG